MKLLYVMNVDWDWIKQRPHFVAEQLSKYYDTTLLFEQDRKKKDYQKNEIPDRMKVVKFTLLPGVSKLKIIRMIDEILRKAIISIVCKLVKPDVIYLTNPNQYVLARSKKYKIIYDCMDDYLSFPNASESIVNQEKIIVLNSDIITVSSENLRTVLINRYRFEIRDKIAVVRNAFNGIVSDSSAIKNNNTERFKIVYFGTISEWFDFDVIVKSLDYFPNIEYLLMGPIQGGVEIPKHNSIKYIGTVPHEKLEQYVNDADACMMPFKLNNLIESVDPVKFYEYINFNKDIISIYYKEIDRYSKYVYFYLDFETFKNAMSEMINNPSNKYSDEDRKEFLKVNTWERRAQQIKNIIDKNLKT